MKRPPIAASLLTVSLLFSLHVAARAAPAAPAAPAASAADAKLFLLTRDAHGPSGVRVDVESLPAGQVAVFPVQPDSGVIDLLLPVGPGTSASLLRPGDRGMIVVRHRGDALQVSFRRPDGSMQERPTRRFADLAREEMRVCVTGGDGTRAAFWVSNGESCARDTVGPIVNMFAGQLPFALASGDWVVQTETWARPSAAAPRGRMAVTRGRYLFVDVVRPDGGKGRMVLDFGAGETVVARAFVPAGQRIGGAGMTEYAASGALEREHVIGGATGPSPAAQGQTMFPALTLGGVRVDSLEAVVMPLPPGLGDDVVGILGIDVLRRAQRVRLDVPAREGAPGTLEFDPPRPLPAPEGVASFSWANGHAVLPGSLGGRAARWIVDSGAPESFADSASVATEPWVRAGRAAESVRGTGERRTATQVATAPTATVGDAPVWANVPVRVARLAPLDALRGDGRVPALLGLSELARMGSFELDFGSRTARWGK